MRRIKKGTDYSPNMQDSFGLTSITELTLLLLDEVIEVSKLE